MAPLALRARAAGAALRPHAKGRARTAAVRADAAGGAKRIVITGGNTGIGYEAALVLAQRGYDVTLACRDGAKAAAAAARLKDAVPSAAVDTLQLDLADLESVRGAAKALLDSPRPVDVLLNNAGVMACPYMTTAQGFEYQFGVNHLGHFLLTTTLLPKLQATPGARIINVASAAHAFGKLDFGSFRDPQGYKEWPAYGQSKLANVMFTYELARRLAADPGSPTVNALHPGVVRTELGRYLIPDDAPLYVKAAWALMYPFTKSPPDGAKTSIFLASSPEVEGVSGKYWDNCKPVSTQPQSYDVDAAKRLYEVSEELVAARALAA